MRSSAWRGLALGICGSLASGAPALAQSPYPGAPPHPGQPPAAEPDLQAGGLRPPDEFQEEETGGSEIEQDLEQSDERDSGRGLQFVWLNGDIGYQYVDLTVLDEDGLLPGFETSQSGVVFGGGAGVRLLYFTVGARFHYGVFEAWDLWSVLGEAGFRIPVGNLEPYVNVGAGYVSLTSFDDAARQPVIGDRSLAVRGVDVRLAGGFDYYLSDTFSLGPQVAVDLLILSRPAIDGAPVAAYAQSGSSTGLSLQGTLVVGLHF